MKNVLAVIKDFKTDPVLLMKAIRFSPEKLCVMVIRSENNSNDDHVSEQITQYVNSQYLNKKEAHPAKLDIVFSDNDSDQALADLLVRAADTYSSDVIMLMKPEISDNMEGLALVKHLLRNATKTKICLCRQKKWAKQVQIMCAVDIESENKAQNLLDAALVKYANSELKTPLSADLHLASVIAISRISEELDLVESVDVLAKKGPAITEKLLAFEQQNGLSGSAIHVVAGLPNKKIPSLVKKQQIDIVVLGNVGRKGIKGLIMGNTSEKIIKNVSSDIIMINSSS